jgi:hypothetical protein
LDIDIIRMRMRISFPLVKEFELINPDPRFLVLDPRVI